MTETSGGLRVLIAAGGTGGHVMPGLALARALLARDPETVVTWAGTGRGIETRAVPAAGIELDLLPILPLSRRVSVEAALAPFAASAGVVAARQLIRRRQANVVVGMGGYVTLPVALGASLARVPVVLHEQNAIPGLANKLAARVAVVIALGVPEAAGAFGGARTVPIGNPVRPELANLDRDALREQALAEFGLRPNRYTIFVFGGSQGARKLNQAIVDTAGRWPHPDLVQVLHACGRRDEEAVKEGWTAVADRLGELHVSVVPFIDRMDLAYAIADLAVTRAGALTVAELTAAGLPSIMVPLPHAVGGHQAANARVLAEAGGVVAVPDPELDGARLVREADELLGRPRDLARMAKTMRDLSRPDAADRLADLVTAAARGQLR